MTQAVKTSPARKPASELPTHYRLLWRLLDAQMQADFDEVQWQSDPEEPWRDWDDDSRGFWLEWLQSIDDLTPIDRLRMTLWAELWRAAKAT